MNHEWLNHIRALVRDGVITSSTNLVALTLAIHYANGSDEAWPSQNELAASTGLSRRTVQTALNNLERHQLIEKIRGSERTSGNVYRLVECATIAHSARSVKAFSRNGVTPLKPPRHALSDVGDLSSYVPCATIAHSTRRRDTPKQ